MRGRKGYRESLCLQRIQSESQEYSRGCKQLEVAVNNRKSHSKTPRDTSDPLVTTSY